MKTNRHTMELTDEEKELILAYRRGDPIEKRNIRVVAFMRPEPAPSARGRIVASNTARSFRDLR